VVVGHLVALCYNVAQGSALCPLLSRDRRFRAGQRRRRRPAGSAGANRQVGQRAMPQPQPLLRARAEETETVGDGE
jgi:hypothetical protein